MGLVYCSDKTRHLNMSEYVNWPLIKEQSNDFSKYWVFFFKQLAAALFIIKQAIT